MGFKKYLSLTPSEFIRILKAFHFIKKRTTGDHEQWEGTTHGQRRLATVQLIKGTYDKSRMKLLVQNMGVTVEEFYRADEKISKRYFGK